MAVGHGVGAQDRPPAEARHGAALVDVRPHLLRPAGAGGDLCRADRKQYLGARPEPDRIGADRVAAVRDADAQDHAPHRVGVADGGRRGGRLPAPGRPALRHHPDRRRSDGAGAGRDDAGGMAAARSWRQARGAQHGGDLRFLAVREVPHGFLHRLQPAAIGRCGRGCRGRGQGRGVAAAHPDAAAAGHGRLRHRRRRRPAGAVRARRSTSRR